MLEELLARSPQQTFLVTGNTDVFEVLFKEAKQYSLVYTKAPQLTIDEARAIASFATEGLLEKTIGIFYFASYSNGAAEVLLKALEEPNPLVTIIIITPYPYTFPQTLRSRMQLVSPVRYALVQRSLKELQKEGTVLATSTDEASDRREALLSFIDAVEMCAHTDNNTVLLLRTYDAKKYVLEANLPPKQVLEYLLLYMV